MVDAGAVVGTSGSVAVASSSNVTVAQISNGNLVFTRSQANTLYWLNLIAAILLGILLLVLIIYAIYSYSSRPAVPVVVAAPVPAAEIKKTTVTEVTTAATIQGRGFSTIHGHHSLPLQTVAIRRNMI